MLLGLFSCQLKSRGGRRSSRQPKRGEDGRCDVPLMGGRDSLHQKLKPEGREKAVRKRVAEAPRSSRQANEKGRRLEELPGEPVGRKRWGAM